MDELRSDKRVLTKPAEQFDFGEEKWGVLFLNRGGPENPDEVEEFLYQLYSDTSINEQPLSILLQKPLAKILSSHRSEEIAKQFTAIGGSPLLRWTRLIASNVKRELSKRYPQVEIFAGMRYSEPTIPDELEAALDEGCRHIILFSMYPHYSKAITGAVFEPVVDWLDDYDGTVTFSIIDNWAHRPEFISFLRSRIASAMELIDKSRPYKMLFVADSVTEQVIEDDSSYLTKLRATASAAGEGYDHILTFQKWDDSEDIVSPDTEATIAQLAAQGIEQLVIVPVSFVSDHLGTLYHIDIELKRVARKAGIETFVRTESFNDDIPFAAFLADLIEEKTAEDESV
ncbi:MAG: ferrochelatase [Candidatus Zixiibacteriota bacterium]